MFVEVESEELDGGGPKRGGAYFVPLARDGDTAIGEVEPRDLSASGLLGASAGVVKEDEDGEIADTVGRVAINLGENGFQFLTGEKFRGFEAGAFTGNGEDALGHGLEERFMDEKVFKEGLNGGEALVAGEGVVAAPVKFVFEVLEKGEDGFDVQLANGECSVGAAPSGEEACEELESIAVAFECVGA